MVISVSFTSILICVHLCPSVSICDVGEGSQLVDGLERAPAFDARFERYEEKMAKPTNTRSLMPASIAWTKSEKDSHFTGTFT